MASATSTCRRRRIVSGRRSEWPTLPGRAEGSHKEARRTMTQAIDLPLPSTRAGEQRVVVAVCFGPFVRHYYIMLLAPLFLFVREDYGVTYTELGLAFTAYNTVSTVVQTPTGFLVDRVNARIVIICG